MELFTLGSGYTRARRARGGARADRLRRRAQNGRTARGVRFDASRHDDGVKTIFGKTRPLRLARTCSRLARRTRRHAPLSGRQAVGLLRRRAARRQDAARARARLPPLAARRSPVVARRSSTTPRCTRPRRRRTWSSAPVGLRRRDDPRTTGGAVDLAAWTWLTAQMGQRLFAPPSVAGWDWGAAWLSTNTMRARFEAANYFVQKSGPAAVADGDDRSELRRRASSSGSRAAAVGAARCSRARPSWCCAASSRASRGAPEASGNEAARAAATPRRCSAGCATC